MSKKLSVDFVNAVEEFKLILNSLNYNVLCVNQRPSADKAISIVVYTIGDAQKNQVILKFNNNTSKIDIVSSLGINFFQEIKDKLCKKTINYDYLLNYYSNFITYLNIAKRKNLNVHLVTSHSFQNFFHQSPIEKVASYDDPYTGSLFEWNDKTVSSIDIFHKISYCYSNGVQITQILEVCYRDMFNENLEVFTLDLSNKPNMDSFLLQIRDLFRDSLIKKMSTFFDLSVDVISNMSPDDFDKHIKILEMEMIS